MDVARREKFLFTRGDPALPGSRLTFWAVAIAAAVVGNGGTMPAAGALLSGQHAPTPLPNGNILIFDNGPHRLDESFPFSRVIEVNPRTNDIVWKYQEGIPSNFFSPRISNAERLPNGNTLINDGWFGRFFEVTSTGDVVWEYVNPYFGPESKTAKAQNNNVFRVYRYTDKEIARSRAAI